METRRLKSGLVAAMCLLFLLSGKAFAGGSFSLSIGFSLSNLRHLCHPHHRHSEVRHLWTPPGQYKHLQCHHHAGLCGLGCTHCYKPDCHFVVVQKPQTACRVVEVRSRPVIFERIGCDSYVTKTVVKKVKVTCR